MSYITGPQDLIWSNIFKIKTKRLIFFQKRISRPARRTDRPATRTDRPLRPAARTDRPPGLTDWPPRPSDQPPGPSDRPPGPTDRPHGLSDRPPVPKCTKTKDFPKCCFRKKCFWGNRVGKNVLGGNLFLEKRIWKNGFHQPLMVP